MRRPRERATTQSSFGTRAAFLQASLFAGIGVQLPFLPLWLNAKGLSADQIALVLASQIAARLLTGPICAFLVDRTGRPRTMMLGLSGVSVLGLVALSFAEGFSAILIIGALVAATWMPIMPIVESYAVVGADRHRLDYGRLRMWGSMSFIGASLGAGAFLELMPALNIIYLMIAAHMSFFIAAMILPSGASGEAVAPSSVMPKIGLSDAARLLGAPLFLLMIAAASLAQATHALYYTFGTVHWTALGLSSGVIGALWAAGVVAEIILFATSGPLIRRLGAAGLLALGAAAAVLRWTGTAFDPPLLLLFALQLLHAFTFGATHLGTMRFILEAVPRRLQTTAQGLYGAVSGGLVMGVAVWLCGPAYAGLEGAAFLLMAALGAAALLFALVLAALWKGETIHDPGGPPTGGFTRQR